MKAFVIAVLLALPSLAYSQAIAFEGRGGPVGSITGSASYIFGERENGQNHDLWGWSVSPEYNLTRRIGFQAELGNYYERISPGQKRLILTAGPRYNLKPIFTVWPFVYGEAGEMKLSFSGSKYTDWDPVARVGVGFEHRLARNVCVTIVPAEYLAHNLDAGGWTSDFSAHAGFTYNFYR